jgi:hypothetical protein
MTRIGWTTNGLVCAVLVLGAAVAGGLATAPVTTDPDPIMVRQGVPVGVERTPNGAIAAADNYVAAEDRALTSAAGMRAVVETDWVPSARRVELAQPYPAAAIAGKPLSFPGLRLAADVAADRLESYSSNTAQIGVWDEITVWSSTVAPTQHWELDTINLVWGAGQWQVASRLTAPDAQTPVPSWTSGGPADRTSAAFDSQLAGMATPYYGVAP